MLPRQKLHVSSAIAIKKKYIFSEQDKFTNPMHASVYKK
jgi:hypothetical protein